LLFEIFQNESDGLILIVVARSVEFGVTEKQQKLFKMFHGKLVVYREQRVGEDVNNAGFVKVIDEIEYVFPNALDLAMDSIVYVVDEDMGFAAVIREVGCDFFAYERAGQVGDFGAARNGIVICYGDEIHTLLSGDSVNFSRFGETLRTAKFLENPLRRANGILGMDMQIDFHHLSL
jgi:hypothetical protein